MKRKKKSIIKAIISKFFVHKNPTEYKLSLQTLKTTDKLYKHFKIIEHIENLSDTLTKNTAKQSIKTINCDVLSIYWKDYHELETFGSITPQLFALCFNEALSAHKDGFIKYHPSTNIKPKPLTILPPSVATPCTKNKEIASTPNSTVPTLAPISSGNTDLITPSLFGEDFDETPIHTIDIDALTEVLWVSPPSTPIHKNTKVHSNTDDDESEGISNNISMASTPELIQKDSPNSNSPQISLPSQETPAATNSDNSPTDDSTNEPPKSPEWIILNDPDTHTLYTKPNSFKRALLSFWKRSTRT